MPAKSASGSLDWKCGSDLSDQAVLSFSRSQCGGSAGATKSRLMNSWYPTSPHDVSPRRVGLALRALFHAPVPRPRQVLMPQSEGFGIGVTGCQTWLELSVGAQREGGTERPALDRYQAVGPGVVRGVVSPWVI